MNITDETLSAFLDAELSDSDMETIREALITDENLANRLAELAVVDEMVAATYSRIDAQPIPAAVMALLTGNDTHAEKSVEEKTSKTAKIIAFPNFQNRLQKYLAIAASVVMVLGLGAIQVLHNSNTDGNWQEVAKVLETAPSGVQVVTGRIEIKPRLTFIDKQGDYCRQFIMTDKKTATENIACRRQGTWQQAVSVTLNNLQDVNSYQTASGGSLLDAAVEDMANGEFFDSRAETEVIDQHWPKK